MTTQETLSKADAVLEIIFKHDQEMPSCEHKFSEIMDEIIEQWRDMNKKVGKVEVFPTQTLPTTANIAPKEHS